MAVLTLIIAGLVLILAGGSWFTGAVTVGVICLIAGIALIVLPLLFGGMMMKGASKRMNRMMDDFDRPSRRNF